MTVDTAAIRQRAEAASVPDAEQMPGGGSLGYDVDGMPTGVRYAFARIEDYTFVLHARADVLALLDVLDESRTERDSWQADVESLHGDLAHSMDRIAEEMAAVEAECERARVLREALAGVVGDEPPISDLTNGYPWAGCSYCYGPHYHSAYHKRMGTYRGEYGQEPPPEPGEDEYAPFTEHAADCPWALARAALATAGGEGATT